MTHARATVLVACLILLAASAAAESSFESSSVTIDGRATVQGTGGAIFVLVGDEGVLWDASAESATLTRTYTSWVAASNPADPENYLFTWAMGAPENPREPATSEETFGASGLRGLAWQPGAALLIRPASPATVHAASSGLSILRAQTDPRFDQGVPADAQAGDAQDLSIHDTLEGEFLNSTLAGGEVEIRGDMVVTVYGLDYAIGDDERRSGQFVTSETGGLVQGSDERHVLELTGATLRLRALSPLFVLTDDNIVVSYVGTFAASDENGSPVAIPHAGSTVSISTAGSRLAVRGADAATSSDALMTRGPDLGPAVLGLSALFAAVLAVALVAWRRRERADDLPMALLAMEERRWGDALPRLTRLASRRPQDVGILVDRALCLEQLGLHSDAARAFERALRASPRHAEAHFYYARTLARLQQRDAGLVHLETALELDPRLSEMARREPVLRGL